MKLNQVQETLLGALAHVLTGKEFVAPADTDWQALFNESKAQAVAPLVFSSIAEACDDAEVFREWKAMTVRTLQNNVQVECQHDALHRLMVANDIPYCIIKGCASSKDYPDPLLRALGDVDFIIPDEYWEQAKQLLIDNGFHASHEGHSFHLEFRKGKVYMEMHHEPFGLSDEKAQPLAQIVPELIENSVEVKCDMATFRMPDIFGHGIVILLHAYRHLMDTGIGVRHLCDWATFISTFSGEEFPAIFKERFQKLGIWKLAQAFGATAHRYLSIPYQNWMGEIDENICLMLMLDIFNGGNFGKGEGERTTQNLSIMADNNAPRGNAMLQLLHGLNNSAMERYPRLMKTKILRPFGWIILSVRYVFRVLTGKRKKAPKNTVQMIAMRRELYQHLNVFDKT